MNATKQITVKDFQNYCNSFFHVVLEISENESSFFAVIKTVKNTNYESVLNNFTQVETLNKYYKVRLSKKDLFNSEITNNFFNN